MCAGSERASPTLGLPSLRRVLQRGDGAQGGASRHWTGVEGEEEVRKACRVEGESSSTRQEVNIQVSECSRARASPCTVNLVHCGSGLMGICSTVLFSVYLIPYLHFHSPSCVCVLSMSF